MIESVLQPQNEGGINLLGNANPVPHKKRMKEGNVKPSKRSKGYGKSSNINHLNDYSLTFDAFQESEKDPKK